MFCTNCGKELIGDEQFCVNCGAPIETNMEKTEDIGVEIEKSTRKNKAWIFIVPGVILLVILSIAAWFLISTKDNKNEKVKNDKEREEHLQEIVELEPLYSDIEIPSIDLRVQNVTPAQKQQGVKWDSTLFYWLEDIDQTSNEDGYLSRCYVNKTLMKDVRDDRLIEYEIYRDPETDEIYKIVSIKMTDDELDLMDYYYQNGIPNFMFFRTDSVYTPTYATPSKIGERFYFANDMMARWRIIREPNVIGEYVLASSENVNYSQSNYFEETEELQKTYDEEEAERLNEAYNTYNAIMEQKSIGILNGTVKDTTGAPMANRVIDIMRTEDNVLLYRTETDENGFFELTTWLDDEECHMVVLGDMEYKDSVVYDVRLDMSQAKRSYPNIILYKESENEYPVHINLFSAEDMRTEENGTMVRNELKGATAIVRAGTGAYTGDEIMTVKADEGTSVTANLPSGTYTVQIDAAGYTSTYIEVIVAEQETTVESYMLPEVPENTYGVVLVWDDPAVDLDLTLFTPYQSTDGDMAHVGGNTLSDTHGNRLLSDNTAGCEVLYINAAEYGNYKLYVNDYTNSVKGNYTADTLTNMSIRIYIYDANGFVTEYSRPLGQNGVVWEVVEISGKQFTPSGRIYNRLDGKKWWTANKAEFNWETCTNLQSVLEDLVYYTLYCGKNGYHNDAERIMEEANNICQGDEESILRFWGLHRPPVEEYIFKDYSVFPYADINYGLTKDQMEYVAYSLTGKNLSFDNLDANLYGDGTGIAFEMLDYRISWNELLNVETEYVGEDTWRIQADVWDGYEVDLEKKVADISFLIARNPGSCYDGFRVVGVESLKLTDGETAMAAYESFLNNEKPMCYENEEIFFEDLEIEMQKCADENYVPSASCVASFNTNYGFIDVGLDGEQELILDFLGENSDFNIKMVISNIDGTLHCIYTEFGWSRNGVDISYAGVVQIDGSDGASSGTSDRILITKDGAVWPIYTEEYEYEPFGISYIFDDYDFGSNALDKWQLDFGERVWDGLFKYEINGEVYYCVEDEAADGAVPIFLEQLGFKCYTLSEMEKLINSKVISIVGDVALAEEIWSCDKEIKWYEYSGNN